jgi:hypothetical protein
VDPEVTWSRVQEAMDYGVESYDLEGLKERVASGDCQLWESENSTIVTEGVELNGGGVGVNVVAAAGNLQEIVGLLETIEQEARASGCKLMSAIARRGWYPTVSKMGWSNVASVYVKRLN